MIILCLFSGNITTHICMFFTKKHFLRRGNMEEQSFTRHSCTSAFWQWVSDLPIEADLICKELLSHPERVLYIVKQSICWSLNSSVLVIYLVLLHCYFSEIWSVV